MSNNKLKKTTNLLIFIFILEFLFLIPIEFTNVFLLVFVFGIMIILLNYLKNIYYMEGMKTI